MTGLTGACGDDGENGAGQGRVNDAADPTAVVRIKYVMSGPYAGQFDVLTDGTTRARTTATSDLVTADGSVETPKGWFEVWVRSDNERFDNLEYDPDRTHPYRQLEDFEPEENPLRVYRPTHDELLAMCHDAQHTGTDTIAGRMALHYACGPLGGEHVRTGIWLDETAGFVLKQTYDDGTVLTADAIDLNPPITADTFSTAMPAGVEEFEPFRFRLPRVGGGEVATADYVGEPLLVVTGDAAGIRAMVARLAPITNKSVVGLLIAIPPPDWEGSLLNPADARSLTAQISKAAGSFPVPVAIDIKGSAGTPISEPAGIPFGGTRPTAIGLVRSDQGLAQVLTETATDEELRSQIAKLP